MTSSWFTALLKVAKLVPLNAPEVERVKLETLGVPEVGGIEGLEASSSRDLLLPL